MNIFQYLLFLRSKNIFLWLEQDKLRFKAPAEVMTESLKTEIQEHKPFIIDFLQKNEHTLNNACIHQYFEAHAQMRPEAIALILNNQQLTYRELNEKSNQLAHLLRESGIVPNQLVGLFVDRSFEMIIGILGILKAGGAYLPIDINNPTDRTDFILQEANINLVLTQNALIQQLPQGNYKTISLDADWENTIKPHSIHNLSETINKDDLIYVIYTSGSTGQPKGVEITHRNVARLFTATQDWYQFTNQDVWTLFHAYNFDFSVWEIWGALAYGGSLVIVPYEVSRSPEDFYELLIDKKVTVLNQTPSAFRQIIHVETQIKPLKQLTLRYIIFGGEALKFESLRPWFDRHGDQSPKLINMYGITETTVHVTYRPVTLSDLSGNAPSVIGCPIPDLQLYILDENLQRVSTGTVGEMYVAGLGLARGYLNQPELTKSRFIPDPFSKETDAKLYRTGDLARYLKNGDIEYLGRADNQVKIRGFRIEIKEIEAALLQNPFIQDAVVTTFERDSADTALVAYVIPHSDKEVDLAKKIRAYLENKIPKYMVPAAFVSLQKMPLTVNGKIDFKALPKPELFQIEQKGSGVSPRTENEKILVEIWSALLPVKNVGIYDNFFELGGDSILAIQVATKAKQRGINLTPKQLFAAQTIAELASNLQHSMPVEAEQGIVEGDIILTPIQEWFFNQKLIQQQHWNQALLLKSQHILNPDIVKQVVSLLLQHHDALRHRFIQYDNKYQQLCHAPTPSIPFNYIDLSHIAVKNQLIELETTASQLQKNLNLEEGPLFTVALFKLNESYQDRLLFIAHHLVIDGMSWRILIEDFQKLYSQLSNQHVPDLLSKTNSYQTWALKLQEYAQQSEVLQEQEFWLQQQSNHRANLKMDNPHAPNNEADVKTHIILLSKDETIALLHNVASAYKINIQEILLTALAATFVDAEHHALLINLEGHGREDLFENVDVSRTIGWFTTIYPLLLNVENRADWDNMLKSIKEQIRAVPHHGIGYGLSRYLHNNSSIRNKLAEVSEPQICFNYLGQIENTADDSFLSLANESIGALHHPDAKRKHTLDISASISAQQLQIAWTYSNKQYQDQTISQIIDTFSQNLRNIIEHCKISYGYTPSDFPLAKLSQQALDKLVVNHQRIEDVYPLSPMQQGFLLYSLYATDLQVGVEQTCITLQGNLNRDAFKKAWERVIDIHPILRTSFLVDEIEQPLQLVNHKVSVDITEQNWQTSHTESINQKLDDYLAKDFSKEFQLSKTPLMRLTLIQTTKDVYHIVWSHHHLLLDGWSVHLVLSQVIAYYQAICSGGNNPHFYAPSYQKYIAWRLKYDDEKSKIYWQDSLKNITLPTPLIIDRVSRNNDQNCHCEQSIVIGQEKTEELKIFAQKNHISLTTLLQAAWGFILSYYNDQSSIVFGTTVAGRPVEIDHVDQMIGMFINVIPVAIRVNLKMSVLTWLKELHAQQLIQREHENSSLFQIQNWCEIPANKSIFDSLLVIENYPTDFRQHEIGNGLIIRDIKASVHTRYPLTLVAVPQTELALHVYYESNHFNDELIKQLLHHWEYMLEQFVLFAHQPLSLVSLISSSEIETFKHSNSLDNDNYYMIMDSQQRLLPRGVPGEIYVSNNQQFTSTHEFGRYQIDYKIEQLGQLSDCIITDNNERIFLAEIENRIHEHPMVDKIILVPQVNQQQTTEIIAHYLMKKSSQIAPQELHTWLSQRLPKDWLPVAYVNLTKPLTNPQPSDYIHSLQYIAPRTKTEEIVVNVCSQLMNLTQISILDDFFSLGGQSILAIQFITRIHEILGIYLPIREIFERKTLVNIANYIDQQRENSSSDIKLGWESIFNHYPLEKLPPLPYYEVSPYQLPELFFNALSPDSPMYNILSCDVMFTGDMNIEAARRTLETIFNRHGIFRIHFGIEKGEMVQYIREPVKLTRDDIYLDYTNISESDYIETSTELAHQYADTALDFKKGPLFFLKLAEFPGKKFLLLFLTNHAVWDEVSILNFAEEFKYFYNAFNAGREVSLAPISYDYVDYTHWINRLVKQGYLDRQKQYWINRFADRPPTLDLPTDFPRPPVQTFNGSDVSGTLPQHAVQKLFSQWAIRRPEITLSNFLLSLSALLLYRLTNQSDIVIGMPFVNRMEKRLTSIMGPFAVGLPIRLKLSPEITFNELLTQTQQVTLEALENSIYPGVLAIQEINPEWDISKARLYPVMFGLQHNKSHFWNDMKLDGLETSRPVHLQNIGPLHSTARCDLRIITEHLFDDIWYSFSYNSDLFLRNSVERMTAQFSYLFEQIIENADVSLDKYRLNSPAEEKKLLHTFNQTKISNPILSVHLQFEKNVIAHPNSIAIHADDVEISYDNLNGQANYLAQQIYGFHFKNEKLVGIYLDKSPAVVMSILAVLKAGAAFLILDKSLPAERLKAIFNDSQIEVIITDSENSLSHIKNINKIILLDSLNNKTCADNLALSVSENQLAYVIYTSGSTGIPKGVMLSHAGIANRIFASQQHVSHEAAILQLSSINFDVSLLEIFMALYAGAKLVIPAAHRTHDLNYLIDLLIQQNITLVNFTPSLLKIVLAEPNIVKCHSLRHIYCGGETMPIDLPEKVLAILPHAQLHNMYGPTETSVDAVSYTYKKTDQVYFSIPIGTPLINTTAYVLNEKLDPLSIGVAGELYIGGVGVARGYLNNPEQTAENFIPDHFANTPGARLYKTGDRARWLADGRIEILSRLDRQVKVRGNRVELHEIETQMAIHPAVKLAAVRHVKDHSGHDSLIGYLELQAKVNTFYAKQIPYRLYTLAQRPELKNIMDQLHRGSWPLYFSGDKVMQQYWPRLYSEFTDYQFALVNSEDEVVALGNAVPIEWDGTVESLPLGWDGGLEKGFLNLKNQMQTNTLLVLAAVTSPHYAGTGLSSTILSVFKEIAHAHHLEYVIAPVRPTGKNRYPDIDFQSYCELKRDDGFAMDDWIRTHERIGGKQLKIELNSQYIEAGLDHWKIWLNQTFKTSGRFSQQDMLQPLEVDLQNDKAIYQDPCVWIQHPLDNTSSSQFIYLNNKNMSAYLRQFLPEYMIPTHYYFIEKMPLSSSGKINLHALPDPIETPLTKKCFVAPQTSIQIKLTKIWQQVLDTDEIGITDDFFNLGGHSIRAMQLVARIQDEFKVQIQLKDLFKDPCILAIEKIIQQEELLLEF